MKLTKQQREQLRLKFGGKCAYCGIELGKGWHADHIEPVVRDWEFVRDEHGQLKTKNGVTVTRQTGKMLHPKHDTPDNLFPACAPCNIDKGTCLLEDWREYLHQRIVVGLRANSSTFRHAERFGVVTISPEPLVFWFEKFAAPSTPAKETNNE